MAKRKKRSSSGRFVLGMLIYALLFLLVVAVGLRFFWSYLEAYENSRPKNTMEEYITSFDAEHIHRVAADFVSTLDHHVQTEEESYAYIAAAMEGKLSYAKLSSESTEDKTTYIISLDGRKLGRVVLTKQADPVLGFSPWTVAEEELDFTWLLSSREITVPDTWKVSCNGNVLDASYLTGEKTPYAILREFYDDGFSLPYMVTYQVDSFVGQVELALTDEDGQPVELTEGDSEALFTDNCSDSVKAEITRITERFVQDYVRFMSDTEGYAYDNYLRLHELVIEGSDLDDRLLNTIPSLVYASSRGDDIVSITLNDSMDLGNSYYYADTTFLVDTEGQKGIVQTTNNMKLLISRTDGEMKVAAIESY